MNTDKDNEIMNTIYNLQTTISNDTEEDAEYAITKIVIPFLLKHSDFEW